LGTTRLALEPDEDLAPVIEAFLATGTPPITGCCGPDEGFGSG